MVVVVVVAEHLLSCWVMVAGMMLRSKGSKLPLVVSMRFVEFPPTRRKASV